MKLIENSFMKIPCDFHAMVHFTCMYMITCYGFLLNDIK